LFLCTGNSARSIIGQALLKTMGGEGFEAFSAGTAPKGINPLTVKVLEEAGLDISGEWSKHVSEYGGQSFDYVITVCDDAAEQCPVFPGAPTHLHWSFRDPAAVQGTEGVKLAAFQATVRGMRQRLSTFIPVAKRAAGAGQG
jgi:arsenate reductase